MRRMEACGLELEKGVERNRRPGWVAVLHQNSLVGLTEARCWAGQMRGFGMGWLGLGVAEQYAS